MILLALFSCEGKTETVTCETCGGDCLRESLPDQGNQHVEGAVEYEDVPPTSGDHWACWEVWGVHEEVVPPEQWVHNLEHGGVVLLYNCPSGCDEDLAELTAWVETLETGRALLTAYSAMDWTFAAVAWRERLLLDCLDVDAFQAFYDENVGHAPEDITSNPPDTCVTEEAGS